MSYKQAVTPNLDPEVYNNGAVLNDWLGMCLAVEETRFGSDRVADYAQEAYDQFVQFKHEDRNVPVGVYVPLWFAVDSGEYAGQGHVCMLLPDGSISSAPVTHKPTADAWGSIAEVEQNYHCRFLGWSEDMVGTRVIEFVADPVPVVPTEPTPEPEHQYHTVVVDDNLSMIGDKYGVSWQQLYEWNKDIIGDNPDLIYPDQVLRVS